jgi:hypothetical protein
LKNLFVLQPFFNSVRANDEKFANPFFAIPIDSCSALAGLSKPLEARKMAINPTATIDR